MCADRAHGSRPSLDIKVARQSTAITVSAQTDSGVKLEPSRALEVVADLKSFTDRLETAARTDQWLNAELLALSQHLHATLLGGEIATVLAQAADNEPPLLVRLEINDTSSHADFSLHDVPWEALCAPTTSEAFWGSSANVCLVRDVPMTRGVTAPRKVSKGISLVAIAPEGQSGLNALENALYKPIQNGEVVFLKPILGDAARGRYLPQSLKEAGKVDIVHFVGHAGISSPTSTPHLVLRNKTEDDDEEILTVDTFAVQLKDQNQPRLVVLECCQGAKRAALASAGQIMIKEAVVDAVLAHLFPIRADMAARCSALFYENLVGTNGGDVARALQKTRRDLLTDSNYHRASVFSPVVYLRSTIRSAGIFDVSGRRSVVLPKQSLAATDKDAEAAVLEQFLQEPCSLVLGDAREEQRDSVEQFRKNLKNKLPLVPVTEWPIDDNRDVPPGLSTLALAQQFELHKGRENLLVEYEAQGQQALRELAAAMAAHIDTGIHVTLLHEPFLEEAVVAAKPNVPVFVLQPAPWKQSPHEASLRTFQDATWTRCSLEQTRLDPKRQIILVRLNGGGVSSKDNSSPWLTEDDYLHGIRDLQDLFPQDVANQIARHLRTRPALLLGVSLRRWHHRATLRKLFSRGLPEGCLAVVDAIHEEKDLWKNGKGLPSNDDKPQVIAPKREALLHIVASRGDGS